MEVEKQKLEELYVEKQTAAGTAVTPVWELDDRSALVKLHLQGIGHANIELLSVNFTRARRDGSWLDMDDAGAAQRLGDQVPWCCVEVVQGDEAHIAATGWCVEGRPLDPWCSAHTS